MPKEKETIPKGWDQSFWGFFFLMFFFLEAYYQFESKMFLRSRIEFGRWTGDNLSYLLENIQEQISKNWVLPVFAWIVEDPSSSLSTIDRTSFSHISGKWPNFLVTATDFLAIGIYLFIQTGQLQQKQLRRPASEWLYNW